MRERGTGEIDDPLRPDVDRELRAQCRGLPLVRPQRTLDAFERAVLGSHGLIRA